MSLKFLPIISLLFMVIALVIIKGTNEQNTMSKRSLESDRCTAIKVYSNEEEEEWPNEIEELLNKKREELESLRLQCLDHGNYKMLPTVSRQKFYKYLDYQISILDGMLYNHATLWMILAIVFMALAALLSIALIGCLVLLQKWRKGAKEERTYTFRVNGPK